MLWVDNYPDCSVSRASRRSKVCIAISRVAVKEKIPEMLPQNEKKISKIRLPNRGANLRKRKKTIGLSAIQHAFVNGSEILQIYLAWKFLRYNYSGYTHDDSKREEKSIEVKTKQQQSPSLQTFVYACSQYLGAIPLIVVEFSSFFRSFWGWFGGVKCVMQPCVGDCRPVLTCGWEKINPKSDFSMQGACMYQKKERSACVWRLSSCDTRVNELKARKGRLCDHPKQIQAMTEINSATWPPRLVWNVHSFVQI